MTSHDFSQVDVFTDRRLLGNPVAVVHGADALDEARMQAFARWTNLSETTFLLAPDDAGADYRVRIFTPGGELPFAGHPTLGSCHAWLERGGVPRRAGEVLQQCAIGLVRIRRGADRLAFAAPPLVQRDVDATTRDAALAALGVASDRLVEARWLRNGPDWLTLLLDSAQAVLAVEPDAGRMRAFASIGIAGAHPAGAACAFEVRGFVGGATLYEDPVTGSLNASLAQWLIGTGVAPATYVASQGTALGRSGRVHVEQDGPDIWIGGAVTTCIAGTLML